MADDIVKRLRDAEWESVLYELAADEIERLRAEVEQANRHKATAHDNLQRERGDRDRLRAALDTLNDVASDFDGRVPPDHMVRVLTSVGIVPHAEVYDAALAGGAEPKRTFEVTRETLADANGPGYVETTGRALPASEGLDEDPVVTALRYAVGGLRIVGDDYPSSSCHDWCHKRADEALVMAGLLAPDDDNLGSGRP